MPTCRSSQTTAVRCPLSIRRRRSSGRESIGRGAADRLARLDLRDAAQDEEAVIGGESVVPLQPAALAPVDDDLFALRSVEGGNWRHQPTAGAGPIAHPAVVDMETVEAVRAMVAVMAAGDSRADSLAAVTAGERVALVRSRSGLRRQYLVAADIASDDLLLASIPAFGAAGIPGSAMGWQRELLLGTFDRSVCHNDTTSGPPLPASNLPGLTRPGIPARLVWRGCLLTLDESFEIFVH